MGMADAASVLAEGNHFVKKAIKVIDTVSTWIGIPSSWLMAKAVRLEISSGGAQDPQAR